MKICDYGCGQEAKYQFKNGKWCCNKSVNSCSGYLSYRPKKRGKNNPQKYYGDHLCDYGCGQEAKYIFNNNKYCCVTHWKKCPNQRLLQSSKYDFLHVLNEIIRLKIANKYNIEKRLCDYGCGTIGHYLFLNGKWCCKKTVSKCSVIRNKNSEKHKGKNNHFFRKKHNINSIELMRVNSKLTISKIKKRYPFFSRVEEMRYNPDKPGEKEIQVHCKYNECENSKEKYGWFTPTSWQLYERIRQIEKDYGNEGNYFYCSDTCKTSCVLYNLKSDPYKEDNKYTREVQPELREMRLKLDNYTCQKCGKKDVELHCHHIEGINWDPLESADIDKVITYCKDCHQEVHKIEGCRYSDLKCEVINETTIYEYE